MTATIIKFPKHTGAAIRCIDDEAELQAAAALLILAVTRPEKRAEIVAKVADYLAGQNNGRPL